MNTSKLAEAIKDRMSREDVESSKWQSLLTFYLIVKEADDPENHDIYYNKEYKRGIMIKKIPSLVEKEGTAFDSYGMQCRLLGLSEKYKDGYGDYLVNVLCTHDLNSAEIIDVNELWYQLRTKL